MAKTLLVPLVGILVLWGTSPAYAYLDPGTGSIILQALLGGAAGALIAGRLYWSKIKSFFGAKPEPDPPLDVENDSET